MHINSKVDGHDKKSHLDGRMKSILSQSISEVSVGRSMKHKYGERIWGLGWLIDLRRGTYTMASKEHHVLYHAQAVIKERAG